MSRILFYFLLLPSLLYASEYNISEISHDHYIIYRASDEEVLAEIKHSLGFWWLHCVNGVKFGDNNEKYLEKDNAINTAGLKCKI